MKNTCTVCGVEFESVKPAKTCSPRCRVTLSRFGVTEDPFVTLAEPAVTRDVTFDYYIVSKANGMGRPKDEKSSVRTAKYWYDVPLGAVPVVKKGWPKLPEWEFKNEVTKMNGRQYFLWWKNNFETGEKGPILYNPHNS